MVNIEIDLDKCDGCGECVDICSSEVYEMQNDKSVVINPDECIECCSCVEVCSTEAITHESC